MTKIAKKAYFVGGEEPAVKDFLRQIRCALGGHRLMFADSTHCEICWKRVR